MIGWVSVYERIPDEKTPVLIWYRGKEQRIAELRWERPGYEETWAAFQYWDCPYNDGQDWGWEDVTYWMPLPEPPEEQTK